MQQTDQHLERIQQKIQRLLKAYNMLLSEKKDLLKKVEELKNQKEQQTILIDELQQKLQLLKAAKSELSEDEKKAFEKRLTEYIKEVDRCIVMLSE
jgi:chromosome segregation ATPase